MQYLFTALFLGFLTLGFLFKKWLLFGAIIFICPLSIFLMQNNPITGLQSWTWLLLIPMIVIPLLFVIYGSLMPKKQKSVVVGDEDEPWRDDEDDNYGNEYKSYKKDSSVYKTKRSKRSKGLSLLR